MPRRKTPLREQRFRIGSSVIGVLIGLAVIFVVPGFTDHKITLSPGVVAVAVVIAVVCAGGGTALGLLIGRGIVGDRIELALRRSGDEKWRHGRVDIGPEHLSFQPYALQVRIPRGPTVELDIEAVGEDTGRRPQLKQIWSINPQLHIIDLETRQGDYELAALPSRITELRDRLQEHASPLQ